MEGIYGTTLAATNSGTFRNEFFKKYGKYPISPYAERVYDIAYILALAMEASKSSYYVDIRNKLRNITEGGMQVGPGDFAFAKGKIATSQNIYFEGASGKMNFDSHGDLLQGRFEVWKIVNGIFTTVAIIPFGNRE
jgi:ABC-type branched-subunit amino acid transport system substrate-binding protein